MKKDKSINNNADKPKSSGLIIKLVMALILILVVVYFGFTCTVREGSCAVILRFGAPRAEITEPGLYFKLPWPFEQTYTYDSRTQYLESGFLEPQTKDKRNIIMQSYSLWAISDPLKFHDSIGGSVEEVSDRINNQIKNATNSILGSYNLTGIVSLDEEQIKIDEIQEKIFKEVKKNLDKEYGIEIIDVSILRISLPDANLESVFEQMRADRQKEIDTIIAEAQRDADIIISNADKEYNETVADAEIEAAEIKAQTEAAVAKIYAEAQAANMELYQFLKELDSIIASVSSDTVLIVTKDTYPFNILLEYSNSLTEDNNGTVVTDLEYILTQLPEKERTDLINAVSELIDAAKAKSDASVGG